MSTTIVLIGLYLALVTIGLLATEIPDGVEEKRTYLFETEDGEQYNPMSDEGVEEDSSEWKYSVDEL